MKKSPTISISNQTQTEPLSILLGENRSGDAGYFPIVDSYLSSFNSFLYGVSPAIIVFILYTQPSVPGKEAITILITYFSSRKVVCDVINFAKGNCNVLGAGSHENTIQKP